MLVNPAVHSRRPRRSRLLPAAQARGAVARRRSATTSRSRVRTRSAYDRVPLKALHSLTQAVGARSRPTCPGRPAPCCSSAAPTTTSSSRRNAGCSSPHVGSTDVEELVLARQLPRRHPRQRRPGDLRRRRASSSHRRPQPRPERLTGQDRARQRPAAPTAYVAMSPTSTPGSRPTPCCRPARRGHRRLRRPDAGDPGTCLDVQLSTGPPTAATSRPAAARAGRRGARRPRRRSRRLAPRPTPSRRAGPPPTSTPPSPTSWPASRRAPAAEDAAVRRRATCATPRGPGHRAAAVAGSRGRAARAGTTCSGDARRLRRGGRRAGPTRRTATSRRHRRRCPRGSRVPAAAWAAVLGGPAVLFCACCSRAAASTAGRCSLVVAVAFLGGFVDAASLDDGGPTPPRRRPDRTTAPSSRRREDPPCAVSETVEITRPPHRLRRPVPVLDDILELGGDYVDRALRHRQDATTTSPYARIVVTAADERAPRRGCSCGCRPTASTWSTPARRCVRTVEQDGVFPEDFYSTTNLETEVRIGGHWVAVEQPGDGLRPGRDRRAAERRVTRSRSATCGPATRSSAAPRGVQGRAARQREHERRRASSSS